MPTDYTLSDLVKLTGVTERTVRYYIAQGLLPPPINKGQNARYAEAHLDRLRIIKKLQLAHLPLAEIRRQLDEIADDDLATLAETAPANEASAGSALDYIDGVLGRRAFVAPTAAPVPVATMPSVPQPLPISAPPATTTEPSRAQWERISLDPDVEIHIRRPLTRHKNRSIERLVTIARQLLEE